MEQDLQVWITLIVPMVDKNLEDHKMDPSRTAHAWYISSSWYASNLKSKQSYRKEKKTFNLHYMSI